MLSYQGIPIHPNTLATQPRMTLSKDVMVSDDFRVKQNIWLEGIFGREPTAYMMDTPQGRVMIAHPTIVDSLKDII